MDPTPVERLAEAFRAQKKKHALRVHCQKYEEHAENMTCDTEPGPREDVRKETISETQRQQLTSRTSNGRTEPEQWFTVWSILFPDVNPPSSPYLKTEVEETVLTAQEIFTRNSSRVFTGLNSTVRLGVGDLNHAIESNDTTQTVPPGNHLEQTTDFVQSVFEELARVSVPEPVTNQDPASSSAETLDQQLRASADDGAMVKTDSTQYDDIDLPAQFDMWAPGQPESTTSEPENFYPASAETLPIISQLYSGDVAQSMFGFQGSEDFSPFDTNFEAQSEWGSVFIGPEDLNFWPF
ncbi:hypothetical protein CkaCkLH20_09505 [Colletotrichum karsti]|uniref:Uncharacterized protein n=1 Tax=Colletotrichum karsti TaxID=1095194 RepID=A0A9P6I6P9_9PEZI|nr:uncharacterized protein CkaCkLH20_09505 [Colletotrichum karsti]KAF9872995.1 hypothetical protein CkaCkLH20_09505 [Colletotrichum karsti]